MGEEQGRGPSRRTVVRGGVVAGATVWLTPIIATTDAVAQGSPTPTTTTDPPGACATVTFPASITAATSPAGMMARIPPRIDTPITVTIAGYNAANGPVVIVADAGSGDGELTLDGALFVNLTSNGNHVINLRGTTQTDIDRGPQIELVSSQNSGECGRSTPFAVSAIPQNWTIAFSSLLTGASRGFVVADSWESDSGVVADLDGTDISEQVQVTSATGVFSGVGGTVSGYLPGNSFTNDTHSTPTAILTGVGVREAQQTSIFRDRRSTSNDIAMTNSGYAVTRTVTEPVAGSFSIRTHKTGAATTANGHASQAGAGTVTRDQAV